MTALILTYHAVEHGPRPLCFEPDFLRAHVDCIAESGARPLTVSQLAGALKADELPDCCMAITFDDGFASVADEAAPLLLERGLTATVYSVAGYLGRVNDWPTQPAGVPRRPLLSTQALTDLEQAGFEIGSHGMDHSPLGSASDGLLQREVLDSKHALEDAVGVAVTSFAYPYGVLPGRRSQALIRAAYSAACTATPSVVRVGVDPFILPRVDSHYLRRPPFLRWAISGDLRAYLLARRIGARARRAVRKDFVGMRS